jgi:RimJ/RimL family protein N-acetyltransferase
VLASTLIGYERFVEVGGTGVDHGARFAARVALEPFVARHETEARTVVPLDEVPALMPGWQPDSLRWLLDAATAAGWPPVELATARDGLVLRELTAADHDSVAALMDRNRDHLTRFGDDFDQAVGLNTRFGVWRDGELIGRVDLNPVNPPNYVLGYWLDERATGHGYATDACRAALDFARSALRAEVMWAGVTHGNHRSGAVLDRLGFERVAELERHTRYRLALSNRAAASR